MKSVNIWQSYKQERDCFVHLVRLANTLLKDGTFATVASVRCTYRAVADRPRLIALMPMTHDRRKSADAVGRLKSADEKSADFSCHTIDFYRQFFRQLIFMHKMADSSEDEALVALASMRKRRKKNRQVWVRSWISRR